MASRREKKEKKVSQPKHAEEVKPIVMKDTIVNMLAKMGHDKPTKAYDDLVHQARTQVYEIAKQSNPSQVKLRQLCQKHNIVVVAKAPEAKKKNEEAHGGTIELEEGDFSQPPRIQLRPGQPGVQLIEAAAVVAETDKPLQDVPQALIVIGPAEESWKNLNGDLIPKEAIKVPFKWTPPAASRGLKRVRDGWMFQMSNTSGVTVLYKEPVLLDAAEIEAGFALVAMTIYEDQDEHGMWKSFFQNQFKNFTRTKTTYAKSRMGYPNSEIDKQLADAFSKYIRTHADGVQFYSNYKFIQRYGDDKTVGSRTIVATVATARIVIDDELLAAAGANAVSFRFNLRGDKIALAEDQAKYVCIFVNDRTASMEQLFHSFKDRMGFRGIIRDTKKRHFAVRMLREHAGVVRLVLTGTASEPAEQKWRIENIPETFATKTQVNILLQGPFGWADAMVQGEVKYDIALKVYYALVRCDTPPPQMSFTPKKGAELVSITPWVDKEVITKNKQEKDENQVLKPKIVVSRSTELAAPRSQQFSGSGATQEAEASPAVAPVSGVEVKPKNVKKAPFDPNAILMKYKKAWTKAHDVDDVDMKSLSPAQSISTLASGNHDEGSSDGKVGPLTPGAPSYAGISTTPAERLTSLETKFTNFIEAQAQRDKNLVDNLAQRDINFRQEVAQEIGNAVSASETSLENRLMTAFSRMLGMQNSSVKSVEAVESADDKKRGVDEPGVNDGRDVKPRTSDTGEAI